mgnify:CR=1 FL=1
MNVLYEDFIEMADKNADEKYREFSIKLTPGIGKNAGVRTPVLKKFAREAAKGDWESFFSECRNELYEERLVRGLIICYIKADIEKRLGLLREFIPLIDNWALCDIVCCAFKFKNGESGRVFEFVKQYMEKNGEFEKRFAVVMLLSHFIDDEHIDEVLELLNNIDDSRFYVSMAAAWALSMCYIKYEDRTAELLKNGKPDRETVNRAILKIIQSRRAADDAKNRARSYRIG